MTIIMRGGKIINRGFKGVVLDMYSKNSEDKETLYNHLLEKVKTPSDITLITEKEEIKINSKEEYESILKQIKKRSKKVLVKKFDATSIMFGSNSKNFNNEFDGYKQLIEIFKGDVSKYTTIMKGITYKNKDVYGISFYNNYYIFLEKCYKTLDNINFTEKTLKKCVKEIMEALDILNAHDYIHNDLKPDNIILCRKRFKIIDWESSNYVKDQSTTFINTKNGNLTYNHPIKFYRVGVPFVFYKFIYNNEVLTYSMLTQLKTPSLIYKLVDATMNDVISYNSKLSKIPSENTSIINKKNKKIKPLSFEHIKENANYYLKLSDYYAFAITIIFLAEKNNIDYPRKIIHKILERYFIKMI